ncbi:MAG: ABC transporter permease [Methanomassiliicoccales archaeon]|nr:ABC transporter permease [Methanomassiliicoccales archaeon]
MIVLGVATLTSIYCAYANIQESVNQTYTDLSFHDALLEIRPTTPANLTALDEAQDVSKWEARLVIDLPAAFNSNEPPVMARVISMPSSGEPTIDKLRYLKGQAPSVGTSDVILETGFANHHNVSVGDTIHLTTPLGVKDVHVAGVALSPEYIWPAKTVQEHMPDVLRRWGAMWMREDALQNATGLLGEVNQVTIIASPEATADGAIRGATADIGSDKILRSETRELQASNVVLGLLVNAVSQMAYMLPLLFMSIVGLSTYVLLNRLVQQQRANIGLLRALGYPPSTILVHYLSYAPLLAGLGALIGFVGGYLISFEVTNVFGSYVSLDDIPVKLRLDLFVIGILLSLAFAGAASIIPAASASRLRPSEAMRPPVPPRVRRSFVERLIPRASHDLRLGVRNILRNPRRSVFTIIGIALAVSVLVVPLVVIDSLNNVTEVAVVRVQQADEILILRSPVNTSEIGQVASVQGVSKAEALIQIQASFDRGGKQREITVMGLEPSSELLQLTGVNGGRVRTSEDGIILSRVFERDGIKVGDSLTLFEQNVKVIAFTEASGTSGFVSLATAQRWAHMTDAANQVMVKLDADADKNYVNQMISGTLPVAAILDVEQAIQDTRDMLRLYYVMVYLILAFGVAIGAAIILDTVSINVLEESRDFATLRMLGIPVISLAKQVTVETMALTVPGAFLGLVLGIILGGYFTSIFSSDLFVLDVYLRPISLIIAFVVGLLVALAAEMPSIRYINRLDLAKMVRERLG